MTGELTEPEHGEVGRRAVDFYFGVAASLVASVVSAKVGSWQLGVAVGAVMLGLLAGAAAYRSRQRGAERMVSIVLAVALVSVGACIVTAQIASSEDESISTPADTTDMHDTAPSTEARSTAPSSSGAAPIASATAPQVAATPAPPTTSADPSAEVSWASQTYMDFDRVGDGGSPKAASTSSEAFDAYMQFSQISIKRDNSFEDAVMVIIDDSVLTAEACEGSTLVVPQLLTLNQLSQRQAICISTSEGHWAILKPGVSSEGGVTVDPVTFDVIVV